MSRLNRDFVVIRHLAAFLVLAMATQAKGADRLKLSTISSVDGTAQPSYLTIPDPTVFPGERPLVVSLHSWSGNFQQQNKQLEDGVTGRGWFLLCPDFRGPNNRPEACGSELAQQDILDAVAQVVKQYPVDETRVYLYGASGGGHMTMLMAALHPEPWAAASAWVGISDLPSWHQRHSSGVYGKNLRDVCGGAPGESEAIDHEYQQRSPLTHFSAGCKIPLELAAGIHDGHTGSVPIRHSLDAFNLLARAAGVPEVTEAEMEHLSRPTGRLSLPTAEDLAPDPNFPRQIHLRRHAGDCRVTIFEGGHEGLPAAALAWLEQFQKPRKSEGAAGPD